MLGAVHAGTGYNSLGPPWSRDQVKWLGRGVFIARIAGDESSRWLLGAAVDWSRSVAHEKIFRKSALDKRELMERLSMNPWPTHMAANVDDGAWKTLMTAISAAAEGVLDTDYLTLWRVDEATWEKFEPRFSDVLGRSPLVVLDGHHSRQAQKLLERPHLFGWIEPIGATTLKMRPIHRTGWLAKWVDSLIKEKKLIRKKMLSSDDSPLGKCELEVIQSSDRFLCEIDPKIFLEHDFAVDAIAKLAAASRGHRVHFRVTSDLGEALHWIERTEVDTILRMPEISKHDVYERACQRRLFPQKATYFYPKLPFGLLVEDISSRKRT